MITKVPYYFKDFECIASDCPDTCCAGWEIVIDGDTYNKYKTITGEFGERLHSEITHYEDGEPGFKLKPNNDCPFLKSVSILPLTYSFITIYSCLNILSINSASILFII